MGWIIYEILKNIIKVLKAEDSINAMALGFVLGGMIGLVPTNFLFIIMMGLLFVPFKINITTGVLGYHIGLFVSFITIWIAEPLGFFLQLRPGPFGAGVGLIDLPPQPLALPVKLPCGALCGRQKLLLRLLQGFFKIGQFVGHSGISHGQVLSAR